MCPLCSFYSDDKLWCDICSIFIILCYFSKHWVGDKVTIWPPTVYSCYFVRLLSSQTQQGQENQAEFTVTATTPLEIQNVEVVSFPKTAHSDRKIKQHWTNIFFYFRYSFCLLGYLLWQRTIKTQVSNLRTSALTCGSIKALAGCFPAVWTQKCGAGKRWCSCS